MGLSGSKGKGIDEKLFGDLYYDFFEKYKTDIEGGYVKIPKDKFTTLHLRVENRLFRSMDRQGKSFNVTKQHVYIINPSETLASKEFVDVFQKKLKESGIIIFQQPTSEANNLDPNAFLIIVCNIVSRIETDIDRDLGGISCDRENILILLHVVDEPKHIPKTTIEQMHRNKTKCIIEMALTIEKGIYDCEINRKAFSKLKEICSYSTTKQHKKQEACSKNDVATMSTTEQHKKEEVCSKNDVATMSATEQHKKEEVCSKNDVATMSATEQHKKEEVCSKNDVATMSATEQHKKEEVCSKNDVATMSATEQHKKEEVCSKNDVATMSTTSLVTSCTGGSTEEPNKMAKTETEERTMYDKGCLGPPIQFSF